MWGEYAEHLPSKIKTKNGRTIIRPSAFFAGLLFLSWAAIYALRYRVGTDFGTYYNSYSRITNNNESLTDFLDKQRDMLFGYIEYFCARLSGGNWIFFSFVCAALTYLPVVVAVRRKSVDFTASALLFLFSMQYQQITILVLRLLIKIILNVRKLSINRVKWQSLFWRRCCLFALFLCL